MAKSIPSRLREWNQPPRRLVSAIPCHPKSSPAGQLFLWIIHPTMADVGAIQAVPSNPSSQQASPVILSMEPRLVSFGMLPMLQSRRRHHVNIPPRPSFISVFYFFFFLFSFFFFPLFFFLPFSPGLIFFRVTTNDYNPKKSNPRAKTNA